MTNADTTQMLATMIEITLKNQDKWVSPVYPETMKKINEARENNKKYELVTDEDGDTAKVFAGFKNEEIEKILTYIESFVRADEAEHKRYEAEKFAVQSKNIEIIENIVKVYSQILESEE